MNKQNLILNKFGLNFTKKQITITTFLKTLNQQFIINI